MNKSGSNTDYKGVISLMVLVAMLVCLASGVFGGFNAVKSQSLYVFPWNPFAREKVLPNSPKSRFAVGDKVQVKGCRGEFEPASFVIHASEHLENVMIEIADLKGSDGKVIPAAAIDVRLVKSWYQGSDGTIRFAGKKVLTPELLLHDESLIKVDYQSQTNYLRAVVDGKERYLDISSNGAIVPSNALFDDAPSLKPFSMPANTNMQVWVTVHIPQKAAPGSYTGNFHIKTAGRTAAVMGLQVEVLPFELSEPLLDIGMYYRGILSEKAVLKITSEQKNVVQYRSELKNMLEHGVQYPTLYQHVNDSSLGKALAIRDQFQFRKDRLFTLGTTTGNKTDFRGLQQLDKNLAVWKEIASQHGYGSIYVYGIDEAVGEKLNAQRPSWDLVHKHRMKVFTAAYEGAVNVVGDILDQPVLSGYKPHEVEQWHKQGKRVYGYGNPQVGVENPSVYRENYGFRLWQGGYDGCMLYAYQHGFGDIWNDFDHHEFRDHVFAYPTRTGVIDTIQWEGFREAVDDLRYLATALNVTEKEAQEIKVGLQARLSPKTLDSMQIRSWLIERLQSKAGTANRLSQ